MLRHNTLFDLSVEMLSDAPVTDRTVAQWLEIMASQQECHKFPAHFVVWNCETGVFFLFVSVVDPDLDRSSFLQLKWLKW